MSNKNPLFLQFINKEVGVTDLINLFSRSEDELTRQACLDAQKEPPDLQEFYTEMVEAVNDIVKDGIGEGFSEFVNHYTEDSIVEDLESSKGREGENVSRVARVKDPSATWIQGLICYNLILYVKAFGTGCLKKCRICGRVFANKGQYAIYCSDQCKAVGKKTGHAREPYSKENDESRTV